MSNKAKGAHWIKPERTKFRSDAKVQEWLASLYPSTKVSYEYDLYRLCKVGLNLTGSQFLQAAEKEPKETSRKVKTYLKQVESKYNGMNAARCKAAMVSYLNFFEVALPLTGLKIRRGKSAPHPLLTWEDASRIISLVDSAYQPVFKLMQWSIDAERFILINNDQKILADVKQQLQDKAKEFIKITIPKRKNNPNPYYILVPRELASYLPVRTVRNEPLKAKWNLHHQWRQALRKSGLPVDSKHGAHNLRSCWLTEATKRELQPELREFQLGHEVDGLNYQRIQQDDSYVLEQFHKAWAIKPSATKEGLEKKTNEIELIKGMLVESLQKELRDVEFQIEGEVTNGKQEIDIPEEPLSPSLKELNGERQRLVDRLKKLGFVEPVQAVK
jgi:hypothetical protein